MSDDKLDLAEWLRERKAAGDAVTFWLEDDWWAVEASNGEQKIELAADDFADVTGYPPHYVYGGAVFYALAELAGVKAAPA